MLGLSLGLSCPYSIRTVPTVCKIEVWTTFGVSLILALVLPTILWFSCGRGREKV